jgi:hypothetical protein
MSRIATPDANGNNAEFDSAYWAHQPPQVQKLHGTASYETRRMKAVLLAEGGFVIDVPIMVYGWDPFKIMEAREEYGYKSVPSLAQPNVAVAPGVNSGTATGGTNDGEIKVSLDFDDYPPFHVG